MALALTGVRVLDLSRMAPGPFCSWLLADFGAEVIRVEEPRSIKGADRRAEQAQGAAARPMKEAAVIRPFDTVSRNKKSIMLNLKDEAGRRIVQQLAAAADVFIEEFRPGVAGRLGIGYEDIRRINPRVIYCSVSLYGQSGPYSGYPGHDPCALGVAGLLGLSAPEDGDPVLFGAPVDDVMAGLHATIGVLVALQARHLTGEGQHVDISMTDSALSFHALNAGAHFTSGRVPRMNRKNPTFGVWRSKDAKYVVTTNAEAHHWANFCRVIGREDLIPRQFDVEHRREVHEILRETFLTKTRDEWLSILHQPGLETQVAPVYENLGEVFADPQVRHRDMLLELDHPQAGKVKHLGFPIKLSGTPAAVRSFAPLPGQHTGEVLGELGYDAAAIADLEAGGVIGR